MPSLSVKASTKGFFNDPDLGKVFAIRSKRPTRNRRTQCSSTTYHEGHDSISADIPMHPGSLVGDPGLAVSSTTASHGNPFARTAFNMAQVSLPVVQAVAGAITVTGPPMLAAIGGLLAILQTVDRGTQNQADLERLRTRLRRLSLYLYNAPSAQDTFEQDRRDAILKILLDIRAKATQLYNRGPACTSVTQDIIGCSSEIDHYLADYSWSSQMQNRHDIHKVLPILQRQQDYMGPTATQLTAAVTLGCVKLVDATGYEHAISVTCCTSFQQLNDMLQVLFKSESIEAQIQRRYMEQGQYDLCIDDNKQVNRLTSHEWSGIEAGTTIVMRDILEQDTQPEVDYQCHLCGAVNRTGAEHSLQRQAGRSINCRVCKRRFQISRGYSSKRKTQSRDDHIPGTEADMHLIRNFHVQQVFESFRISLVPRGSLHDYLGRNHFNLSERQKSDILFEVVNGIEYLHKQGMVHGNLTGDTIFYDGPGRVRIADIQIFNEQLPGDARYIAPESITRDYPTEARRPSQAGDVYSYGCIVILVLSGKLPYWWISEEAQVLAEKLKGTKPFGPIVEMDEVQLNLVQECLSEEKFRPSIEKVRYLVLVQGFGAVDLTNSVQRLNRDPQNFGGFAIVHRCEFRVRDIEESVSRLVSRYQYSSLTCNDVAVKEIKFDEDSDTLRIINRLFREIKLWLKLEHENIVPLLGVTDGFGSLPALVSPWFQHGTLTVYLQREHKTLSYNAKFVLLRDVARGLHYLHSQSVIHGDLSGNNVLIDKNGKASLADFGLSAFLPESTSQALLPTNPSCTAPYMAPEYLICDDEGNVSLESSPKSDVYSFGGIMLQVLEGKIPYHYVARPAVIITCISQGKTPRRPPAPVVGDVDWDFIQRCWSRDMEHRPSDEAILEFVEGRAVLN